MNSEQVKDILKVALELKEGDSMSIEVPSKGHGFSLRTMFYKERLKILKSGIEVNVSVSAIIQKEDGQWIVILSHEKPLRATIHKGDGSSSTVAIGSRVALTPDEEISEDVLEILKKHRNRKEEKDDK